MPMKTQSNPIQNIYTMTLDRTKQRQRQQKHSTN